MQRLRKIIVENPLEVISALLFVPLFFFYPGIMAANLFVLLIIVVSYIFFTDRSKTTKTISAAILLFSLLAYYLFAFPNFSYIFIALVVISAIALVYLAFNYEFNIQHVKIARHIFSKGLLVVIIFPLVFLLSMNILVSLRARDINSKYENITDQIKNGDGSRQEAVNKIAIDPFVTNYFSAGKFSDLSGYLQNLMVSNDFDYLAVVDSDKIVVVRAHRPKAIGDDYNQIIPDIKSPPLSGIYFENNRPVVLSIAQITDSNSNVSGYIAGGNFIDSEFLNKFVSTNVGVAVSSSNNIYITGHGNSELSKFISSIKSPDSLQSINLINFDGNKFLLISEPASQTNIHFLLYKKIDIRKSAFVTSLLAMLCLVLLIYLTIKLKNSSLFSKTENRDTTIRYAGYFILEYSLLAALLVLLCWRSFSSFYQGYFKLLNVDGPAITLESPAPSLQLQAPSYASLAAGDKTVVGLSINNLSDNPANTQVLINFDPQYMLAEKINTSSGYCQKVYDSSIDNDQGTINISCDLKNINQNSSSSLAVAEISFTPKKIGISNINIDQNYSNILTAKGKSNQLKQTFLSGENILFEN